MRALRWASVISCLGVAAAGCTDAHRTGKHARGRAAAAAVTSAAPLDPSFDPTAVRGVATFEDPIVDPETGRVLERRPAAIAGAAVFLLDRDGRLVGQTTTGPDGSFAARAEPGVTEVVVRVEALQAAPLVGVFREEKSARPWALVSRPVAPGGRVELTARGDAAAPFDVLATTQRGVALARLLEPEGKLRDLQVVWAPDSVGTFFDPQADLLHLDAGDGHDDSIVLHEVGHWVVQSLVGDPSPGGLHFACPAPVPQVLDRRLAFSEGLASAFSAFVRGDARLFEVGEGIVQDVELPCLDAKGPGAENAVAAVLWDLFDGASVPSRDGETVSIPLPALWLGIRALRDAPHHDVAALADALIRTGAVARAQWDAVASPLGLALPLPPLAHALALDRQACGTVDASARQPELLAASGYHLVDVPAKGTLTVNLTTHAALTLLVFAPAPHGAFVAVAASTGKTTLAAPALVPGKYLVQVRAKGDGKGKKGATYTVRASFARGDAAP